MYSVSDQSPLLVIDGQQRLPDAIVKTIESATWTLDIAIYGLHHPKVSSAIKQASEEGVRIRMLLNDADKATKLADKLEGFGVDVRHVNKTLHHKFVISDSRTLTTGTCSKLLLYRFSRMAQLAASIEGST